MHADDLISGHEYDYRRSPSDIRRVTYTGKYGCAWFRFEYTDKSSILITAGMLYRILPVT